MQRNETLLDNYNLTSPFSTSPNITPFKYLISPLISPDRDGEYIDGATYSSTTTNLSSGIDYYKPDVSEGIERQIHAQVQAYEIDPRIDHNYAVFDEESQTESRTETSVDDLEDEISSEPVNVIAMQSQQKLGTNDTDIKAKDILECIDETNSQENISCVGKETNDETMHKQSESKKMKELREVDSSPVKSMKEESMSGQVSSSTDVVESESENIANEFIPCLSLESTKESTEIWQEISNERAKQKANENFVDKKKAKKQLV